ncbi:MAG: M56 family metallopeptidase [Acidobacteriia bacterium]|nr:M56 family metallopeptidase [Terriglobia bacterium]
MNAPLWFSNLVAYWLQVAVLVIVGTALAAASRLRLPRAVHAYWQGLLAASLLLPLVQPWQRLERARVEITGSSRIDFDPGVAASHFVSLPATKLVLFILVSGILLRLAWLAVGFSRLRFTMRRAHRLDPLPGFIQSMQTRLGVGSTFYLADGIEGPATFGIRRPTILLPARFLDMKTSQQEAIVAHELLHVRRRDWAFNLAEEIILASCWFHPAVWWLVNRIRLSREQVVDREVVELVGARKPYLYALVEIAAAGGPSGIAAAPAFLNESQLAERIRMLVKEDVMSKRRIVVTLAGLVALTLLAGLASVRAFPLKAAAAAMAAPKENETKTVAVDKDVVKPVPIFKPEPTYTQEAKDAKLQGTVILRVTIGADGNVSHVKVVSPPLGKGLDEKAVEAVQTWRFKPATKAGKPVAVKSDIEINFRLY